MNEKCKNLKKFLLQGYNQAQAGRYSGISPKTVNYYVKTYGLKVLTKFHKYRCNHLYFDDISTENKAYLLGFFLADGCLVEGKKKNSISKRICFNNSIDDIEVIELARNEISPESKIFIKYGNQGVNKRKAQSILRISSESLYETLNQKYGIVRNKTHDQNFTFNFELIPNELIPHFIRGYFDGDGSVSFYLTKKTIFLILALYLTACFLQSKLRNILKNYLV